MTNRPCRTADLKARGSRQRDGHTVDTGSSPLPRTASQRCGLGQRDRSSALAPILMYNVYLPALAFQLPVHLSPCSIPPSPYSSPPSICTSISARLPVHLSPWSSLPSPSTCSSLPSTCTSISAHLPVHLSPWSSPPSTCTSISLV